MTVRPRRPTADREALLELLLAEEDLAPAPAGIPKRPADDELVLSYAQERLWFLQQLEADTEALSIRAAVRLRGPLDLGALRRSLDDVIERHSTLRTTIASLDGRPVPTVADHAVMPVVVDDVRSDPDPERRLRTILLEEAQRTFDLATELPVLVRLVRLGDDDHVLSVVMHHVAAGRLVVQGVLRGPRRRSTPRTSRARQPALATPPIEYARLCRLAAVVDRGRQAGRAARLLAAAAPGPAADL